MSRTASIAPIALPTLSALPPVSRLLIAAALVLARWEDRRRTRIALDRLTGHQLRDIGLSQAHALQEAAKPFWRA